MCVVCVSVHVCVLMGACVCVHACMCVCTPRLIFSWNGGKEEMCCLRSLER